MAAFLECVSVICGSAREPVLFSQTAAMAAVHHHQAHREEGGLCRCESTWFLLTVFDQMLILCFLMNVVFSLCFRVFIPSVVQETPNLVTALRFMCTPATPLWRTGDKHAVLLINSLNVWVVLRWFQSDCSNILGASTIQMETSWSVRERVVKVYQRLCSASSALVWVPCLCRQFLSRVRSWSPRSLARLWWSQTRSVSSK